MENDIAKCPLCNLKLFSDAEAKSYCKLCGMITNKRKFCCKKCKDTFNSEVKQNGK